MLGIMKDASSTSGELASAGSEHVHGVRNAGAGDPQRRRPWGGAGAGGARVGWAPPRHVGAGAGGGRELDVWGARQRGLRAHSRRAQRRRGDPRPPRPVSRRSVQRLPAAATQRRWRGWGRRVSEKKQKKQRGGGARHTHDYPPPPLPRPHLSLISPSSSIEEPLSTTDSAAHPGSRPTLPQTAPVTGPHLFLYRRSPHHHRQLRSGEEKAGVRRQSAPRTAGRGRS